MRIVLSNIGTFGDINPLIAISLELKRRGHTPVLALPNVYRPKIEPLGLAFHTLRPDIDPKNSKLVEMVYDVKKGTETGLREFLFPVLRQTYDDLLEAATKPVRADLLLLGELNYAGPIVAEVTGIPWASYVLAPFSFFSAFDPPVLPPYPKLARADKLAGMGSAMRRLARFVTRKWPEPIYDLRRELGLPKGANPIFDAKHSPNLVLALFSTFSAWSRKTGRKHAHHRLLLLRFRRRQRGAACKPRGIPRCRRAAGRIHAWLRCRSRSRRFLRAIGPGCEETRPARRAAHRCRSPQQPSVRPARRNCVAQYAPYTALFPRAAAIVHQGGVGTTAQCLRAGRPMIIMPYSHDQPDNARRMSRLGVARVIQRSSSWR